jgi:acyl carrier protein
MNIPIGEIEERLKKVLLSRSTQPLNSEEIRPDLPLVGKGLGLDSVALLELVVGIEEEFGILLDDSALTVEHFESLSTLARYVQTVLDGKA